MSNNLSWVLDSDVLDKCRLVRCWLVCCYVDWTIEVTLLVAQVGIDQIVVQKKRNWANCVDSTLDIC